MESKEINIPESAKLDATDKSMARIKMTIIWLRARIIKIEVSVRTSEILEGVTKRGLAKPTATKPIMMIAKRIKSLLVKNFFISKIIIKRR